VQIVAAALLDKCCCLVGIPLRLSEHDVTTNGRNKEKNIVANVRGFVKEGLNKHF
jgi:hypothetical protein